VSAAHKHWALRCAVVCWVDPREHDGFLAVARREVKIAYLEPYFAGGCAGFGQAFVERFHAVDEH